MLSALETLEITDSSLLVWYLPKEIGYSNLKDLNITGSSLEGQIPEEILFLQNLESIILNENCLSGDIIPRGILNLPKLKNFSMGGRQLKVKFPNFINENCSLREHILTLLKITEADKRHLKLAFI